MSTDADLDQRLRAADVVRTSMPALPEGFLRHVQGLDEPASVVAARQLVDDAHAARQQRRSRRRRRSAVLLGAAAAVTAGLLVGPSADRAPSAFADWQVTPEALSAAESAEQAAACRSFLLRSPTSAIGAAAPAVVERRGSWEFTVLVGTEQQYSCLLRDEGATGRDGHAAGGAVSPWTDGPDTDVTVQSRTMTQALDGEDLADAWGSAVGRATSDVTAVDLVFPDGQTVHATLSGTWWAAWWPGQVDEDMQGGPTTVRYTTADGRTVEQPC